MATRKFDQARLDQLVEAAKGSEHPYRTLEGKRFNLSSSVARTLVVGSGLSKSAPEVLEREATRIAKWLEQGSIGPSKAAKPKAKPKVEKPDAVIKIDEPEAIEFPEAAATGVDAANAEAEKHRSAPRKRAPRKTGEASGTAKAIASNRGPIASV
jgi:hypothetical protein